MPLPAWHRHRRQKLQKSQLAWSPSPQSGHPKFSHRDAGHCQEGRDLGNGVIGVLRYMGFAGRRWGLQD